MRATVALSPARSSTNVVDCVTKKNYSANVSGVLSLFAAIYLSALVSVSLEIC